MKLRSICLAAFMVFGVAVVAHADDLQDIQRMMRSGQMNEALVKVDTGLIAKPRDPQLRFFKGLILTEQKKPADAIAMFLKLTEDFPELPEPYNNLAVLYGSQGQYDKARAALEMAIRTHPSYATAHENLGDVYTRLASQSYDKALALDANNSGAQIKLAMIKELVSGNPKAARSTLQVAAAPATTALPAPAAVKPAPAALAPPAVAAAPVATPAPVKPAAPPVAVAPAAAPAAVTAPAPAAAAAPSADQANSNKQVLDAVQGWASAWSRRDVPAYLAAYAPNFKTPGNTPRNKWEHDRRARIEGKSSIKVTVDAPQVTVNGDSATVTFRQRYDSDRLDVVSRKTLVFGRVNGKWLIREERSSS
jgi:tetratricopeptide (TPR) repeat protein